MHGGTRSQIASRTRSQIASRTRSQIVFGNVRSRRGTPLPSTTWQRESLSVIPARRTCPPQAGIQSVQGIWRGGSGSTLSRLLHFVRNDGGGQERDEDEGPRVSSHARWTYWMPVFTGMTEGGRAWQHSFPNCPPALVPKLHLGTCGPGVAHRCQVRLGNEGWGGQRGPLSVIPARRALPPQAGIQ